MPLLLHRVALRFPTIRLMAGEPSLDHKISYNIPLKMRINYWDCTRGICDDNCSSIIIAMRRSS